MNEQVYNSNLPAFLQRSQEQLDEERKRQERLRRDLNLKGAKQTPAEIEYARSFDLETAIRANLEQIKKGTDAYKETLLQLAEVKAQQGDFFEASALANQAGSPAIANDYSETFQAVIKDDESACECVPETVKVSATGVRGTKTVEIPSEFVAKEVYSAKHGRLMPLVKCAKCGDVNVRAFVPKDLSELEGKNV